MIWWKRTEEESCERLSRSFTRKFVSLEGKCAMDPIQFERVWNLNLEMDDKYFFRHLVIGKETWVYLYDPETNEESKQWKYRDSPPPPKKFNGKKSALNSPNLAPNNFHLFRHLKKSQFISTF